MRLGSVELCARHALFAKDATREITGTVARMAGAALEQKYPAGFAAARTVFQAIRAAHQSGDQRDKEPT
jgi:hypothetical protein